MNNKLLIIFALFFVGCIKEPIVDPSIQSDKHLFNLSIESFSDEVIGSTRAATSDCSVDRGYIIYYNSASGAYKGYESIADLSSFSQSGSTIKFTPGDSEYYSIDDKIIAIFNHDVDADQPTDFSKVTSDNLGDYFPLSAEYLEKVETEMNSKHYSLGMPMYLNDFTDSDRAVREVYRSVARMELFIKDGLTIEHDSHTHAIGVGNLEFTVVNNISNGSVGGVSKATQSCFDVNSFSDSFPYSLTSYSTSADDTSNKVYLYPYSYSTQAIDGSSFDATTFNEKRFAIILKHGDHNVGTLASESRYYKLNLLDKATSTYFDVKSNHNYRVVIKAVNSRGYATLKEAYEMPPSNIEYEIYDDKGGLTYSNGQYAISMDEIMSYDEILVYGEKETTLEFNNIRYVLPYGGEMASSADFTTNEVLFEVLETKDASVGWVPDEDKFTVVTESDFSFSDGKSVLTAEGKSIKMTFKNAGECKIKLRIRLGNLEMGRDEITIKKIATNGDGNGTFDAHPNHFEIADQKFIDGSWQSDDLDFGARASSASYDDIGDNGTVIYMGENTTPTGYKTMDGYVSGQNSINSYPVFSPKTRKGYYSYKRALDGEIRKVMIQLEQLAPFYLGHFGSTASDESLYHYKGLVCEKIEEIESTDWRGGVLEWSKKANEYYSSNKSDYWDDYLGLGERYRNHVEGLHITTQIVERNNFVASSEPVAAQYCYMKNDINGNGKIDSDEKITWYLPAQNQMLAMWINMNVFDTDDDLYRLHNIEGVNDSCPWYWTSSEVDETISDYSATSHPTNFANSALRFNVQVGQNEYGDKVQDHAKSHVRCVREL